MAATAQSSRLARPAVSPWGLTLAGAAIAGIALRVWAYRSAFGPPNSDEAVVGLMVRHALHGHLSVFFWGQPYGGTQEVMLTVPVFLITGSGWLSLRIVPIALSALAALLVWRVGRRTIGGPAAAAAGMIFWIWPPFNLLRLTHQQGFYASDVVYCALLLLLALRVVERPDRARVGLFGLVLGLAFWQTAQIVPIAAPAILWTIWKQPRSLRHAWVAGLLAALGALPWIVWNALHGWASLTVDAGQSAYLHSLRILVSPLMPMTIGLRSPYSGQLLLPPAALTYLIYATLAALFVYGGLRSRTRPVSLLYVTSALFPFLYAVSRKTSYIEGWPQYTVVFTPILALLFAQAATRHARATALVLAACIVSIVTVNRMDVYVRTVTSPVPLAPRDIDPLIAKLDSLGVDRVYADYWVAYRLDFDTRERIIAVENRFAGVSFASGQAVPSYDSNVRYRPYDQTVQKAARHGFVFFRQTVDLVPIVPELEHHGYRRFPVGPFVVLSRV